MNRLRPLLCLAALAFVGTAFAAVPNLDRTPSRINDILGRRLTQRKPPAVLTNPFGPPGTAPAANPTEVTRPSEPAGDIATLRRYASSLKISGTVDIGGKPHLVINASAYGEGDLIKVRDSDPIDFIRVNQITPRTLTLGYGSATLEIPLRLN